MDWNSILLALHIVAWVSWLAGFFYIGRLFVYHVDADLKSAEESSLLKNQYNVMMKRVYKAIINPSMMVAWTAGIALIVVLHNQSGGNYMGANGWLHVKLTLLVLLLVYHFWVKGTMNKLIAGKSLGSSVRFRFLNEVPTLFLIAIVSLAIFKNNINYLILFIVLVVIAALMYMAARKYGKRGS